MTTTSRHPIVDFVFGQLSHGAQERYTLEPAALARVEVALRTARDLEVAAPALGEVAWMLHAKLSSPAAGKQLVEVLQRARPLLDRALARVVADRASEAPARGQRLAAFSGQSGPRRAPAAFSAAPAGTISARSLLQARAPAWASR